MKHPHHEHHRHHHNTTQQHSLFHKHSPPQQLPRGKVFTWGELHFPLQILKSTTPIFLFNSPQNGQTHPHMTLRPHKIPRKQRITSKRQMLKMLNPSASVPLIHYIEHRTWNSALIHFPENTNHLSINHGNVNSEHSVKLIENWQIHHVFGPSPNNHQPRATYKGKSKALYSLTWIQLLSRGIMKGRRADHQVDVRHAQAAEAVTVDCTLLPFQRLHHDPRPLRHCKRKTIRLANWLTEQVEKRYPRWQHNKRTHQEQRRIRVTLPNPSSAKRSRASTELRAWREEGRRAHPRLQSRLYILLTTGPPPLRHCKHKIVSEIIDCFELSK